MSALFETPKGGRYLVPHPLDKYGLPPMPGVPYQSADVLQDLDKWLGLQGDITEHTERAEELDEEAAEERDEADKIEEKANALKAAIVAIRPEWKAAMDDGDDPRDAPR